MKKTCLLVLFAFASAALSGADSAYDSFLNDINKILTEHNLNKTGMTARDFNAAGMYFYDRKLWYEAEMMFFRAIDIDPHHALANYNLACVLSLQFLTKDARHPSLMDVHVSNSFYYLYQAVLADSGRMRRARNDSDLNNIREYDPVLFDAITLPEDKRKKYEYEAAFEEANSFEGDIQLVFADDSGEKIWLPATDEKLGAFGLYSISQEAPMPHADTNKDKVGKKFKIVIVYYPGYSDYVGGPVIFKKRKLISIKPLP